MIRTLNLKKDPEDIRDFSFEDRIVQTSAPFAVPDSVDYTSDMSPVKNQGDFGSCVGFAVTAMKEWQEQTEHEKEIALGKFNHRDEKYRDLAESWVYWMCKRIDLWPNEEGTSIRYAMKVLQKIGVPCEKAWPYSAAMKGEPKSWAHLVARWSAIKEYNRVSGGAKQLKIALAQGPVVGGIDCFSGIFDVRTEGIVPTPSNSDCSCGGHAVCFVGYNNEARLFKFKNSWGIDWGEQGYGYLSYTYIDNYLWDAWVAIDLTVTRDMLKGAVSLL